MKKIVGLLKNRWFLSILGLLALCVTIWLLGPLIGIGGRRPLESLPAQLVAIFVVVLLWMLNELRRALRANRANTGMVEGIVAAEAEAGPDRSTEEVDALRRRFQQATTVLRKSKGRRGRLGLYDLPWYIIIGPPGSGKTTALVNSGLDFPLADQFGREALGGVGGTRNCDWWFTDEAILLDTAGRYTTQDSDASVDRSAWEGFLSLLKKYRRRRPINGVLVAISLLDLMTQSEHERAAHARAIRTRVQELDQFFKIRFPVYVVLTKCDLVAGFMEFFDDLGRPEREQVWGMTFPVEASDSDGGSVERFGAEFDLLLERLSERLLWRMSQERDPRRRAAIYGFPRQLASLKGGLDSFLADAFRGNRFEPAPMLRGVYFTSGTQEGTPIDRLMGSVARGFGLDQQAVVAPSGAGRSYFIKSLLTNVVFAESEVAGTNRRLEVHRALLQKAAYVGCLLLASALVVGWTVSYFNNRNLVEQVRTEADTAQRVAENVAVTDTDVLSVLPALDAARTIPGGYGDRGEGAPLFYGLGLYQGRKLGRHAEAAYERALKQLLLPRLILRLEDQLRAGGDVPDRQYLALKTYLMLDSQDHYEADEVTAWFDVDFDSSFSRQLGAPEREALSEHIHALFASQPNPLPLPLDQELITEMQRIVARMPPEQRIYNRLKRGGAGADLPEFTLRDAAGRQGQRVFTRRSQASPNDGIAGFFTRAGYRQVFLERSTSEAESLIDENWILGPNAEDLNQDEVLEDARELYLEDYIRQYDDLIADVQLVSFGSSADTAADVLRILSDSDDSPLLLLLEALAEETQLVAPLEQNVAVASGDRSPDVRNRLEELVGGDRSVVAQATGAAATDTTIVDEHFEWIRDLLGDDPGSAPIQDVLAMFDDLYTFMSFVADNSGARGEIPQQVADQGRGIVQDMRTAARREPAMVQAMLIDAASRSESLAFRGVMATINNEWQSGPLPLCRDAIEGRYPIVRDADQVISLDAFGEFFGPDGVLDTFFDQYLAVSVDTTQRPWRVRPGNTGGVRIREETLRQFERANAIRQAFFRRGSNVPSVSFRLIPQRMDSSIDTFTLDIGGQRLVYANDPQRDRELQWPSSGQNLDVRMEMAPGGSSARASGPWAWYELLESNATIEPGERPQSFNVTFTIDDRSAYLELIPSNPNNPFSLPELEQFSCPESI